MLFYALALVPMALACGPAAGPTTDKPTMRFNYSCPLAWTYDKNTDKTAGGQSLSMTAAQNRIKADIEFAVIKAIESYGYSTSGVTLNDDAVKADEVHINPKGLCETVGDYVAVDGVVIYKCNTPIVAGVPTDANSVVDRHDNVAITITSPVALALSQWENIATKVWANLVNTAGVKFYGLIQVDTK